MKGPGIVSLEVQMGVVLVKYNVQEGGWENREPQRPEGTGRR